MKNIYRYSEKIDAYKKHKLKDRDGEEERRTYQN